MGYFPKLLLFIALSSTLFCCKKLEQNSKEIPTIDITEALENPVDIKLSLFGNKIEYIPMELTDSSLFGMFVEGMNITDEYITVTTRNLATSPYCMVFNRGTGKFLNRLGHYGQDPESFKNPNPVYDKYKNQFVFSGFSDKLIAFDPDDKFSHFISIPVNERNINTFIFKDHDLILYDGGNYGSITDNHIYRISNDGKILDSLCISQTDLYDEIKPENIKNSIILLDPHSHLPGDVGIKTLDNGKSIFTFHHFKWLWSYKNNIRFYRALNDTIYNYTDDKLLPEYSVVAGYKNKSSDLNSEEFMKRSFLLSRGIFENSESIVFLGDIGIENTEGYFVAKYDKNTGKTIAGRMENRNIENDIDGFAPIPISYMTENGCYAGFLTVDDIFEWIENNPDYKFPQNLTWLKDISEDSNPVLVIISSN